MKKGVFTTADILLPSGINLERWSVIACDQFSSEPDYWEKVRMMVGNDPSTLNMMIPEVYLPDMDIDDEVRRISLAMDSYMSEGLFQTYEDSYIYVERTMSDGSIRRGLIGAVDLDEYSFTGEKSPILASEGTVLERLPVRIQVRRAVQLELPHVLAFINDAGRAIIEPLSDKTKDFTPLYDFHLMENGGHIKGIQISGDLAQEITAAIASLGERSDPLIVIGDGNHSLASAKVYWDELKQGLSTAEREKHPARKALIEINNVYDSAINIEAIHRVVFNVDASEFLAQLPDSMTQGNDYQLLWHSGEKSGSIGVAAPCIGDMLAALQEFLDDYSKATD